MSDDTWVMTLLSMAATDCVPQRAAIRELFYKGYEVDWIADTAQISVPVVQDALNRIP